MSLRKGFGIGPSIRTGLNHRQTVSVNALKPVGCPKQQLTLLFRLLYRLLDPLRAPALPIALLVQ